MDYDVYHQMVKAMTKALQPRNKVLRGPCRFWSLSQKGSKTGEYRPGSYKYGSHSPFSTTKAYEPAPRVHQEQEASSQLSALGIQKALHNTFLGDSSLEGIHWA